MLTLSLPFSRWSPRRWTMRIISGRRGGVTAITCRGHSTVLSPFPSARWTFIRWYRQKRAIQGSYHTRHARSWRRWQKWATRAWSWGSHSERRAWRQTHHRGHPGLPKAGARGPRHPHGWPTHKAAARTWRHHARWTPHCNLHRRRSHPSGHHANWTSVQWGWLPCDRNFGFLAVLLSQCSLLCTVQPPGLFIESVVEEIFDVGAWFCPSLFFKRVQLKLIYIRTIDLGTSVQRRLGNNGRSICQLGRRRRA
mmetsp:Transcript_21689/g.56620  ORF Transcript_21689/g.56620 Transcript_21689/m.56620 type:complete len:252 (-) Transcript_21689:427-1182(-)